jgi:hypothetical protein
MGRAFLGQPCMRVQTGSIICEQDDAPRESTGRYQGNLTISISHAIGDRLVIERADIQDLVACLRKLGHLEPVESVVAIAQWVRGDGTDAQRLALADGILQRWG